MPLRCGGILKKNFIANLLVNLSVQEFLKSVSIWRSYGQKSGVIWLFGPNFPKCRPIALVT